MRSILPQFRRTFLATIMIAVTACGSDELTGPDGLGVARARWADRGPSSYTITIQRSCECLRESSGPVEVTVRDGVVTSRRYTYDSSEVSSSYALLFPSVDELFRIVDNELRRGTKLFELKFDAKLGYPTRVAIDNPAVDGPVTSVSNLRAQ
ncbi:MAG: DUF6174 domain-containing protein [Gemmatimonadaceae bacterium]